MPKILSRDFKWEIETGTATYTEIKGLTSFQLNSSKNDADTTTFDDDGWQSHIVASLSKSVSFDGLFDESAVGVRDAGQAAVEALADAMGDYSIGDFKMTTPGGKAFTMSGSVNITSIGGGNDDPSSWGFELTLTGKITPVT